MVPSAAFAGLVAPITSRSLAILALERHHDNRAFDHELHQAGEERPLAMHRVETFGLQLTEARHAQRQYPEPFHLQRRKDFAGVSGGDGIRLDNRKRPLDAHKRLFTFSPISAGDEHTVMPASCMARILSTAAPDPPEMIAPA